jgi:hypothetical protein
LQDDAIIPNWNFKAPDWTRAHPLPTSAYLRGKNVERIELRRDPVRP